MSYTINTAWHGVPSTATVAHTVTPISSSLSNNWWNMNSTGTGTITLNTTPINAALVVSSATNNAVLTVHYDGRIEYTGKPSKASDAFLKSCSGHIDLKAAGELALEKTYRRAVERCLRQARSMSHEDFISMLENELNTRMAKAAWMRLSESDTEEE